MSPIDRELLTEVLHAAYDAAPEPLYPSQFVQQRGLDRAELDRALDDLRMRGLVRLTPWTQGVGQGYTLTQAGLDAIENPHGFRPEAMPARAPRPEPEPYDDEEPRRPVLIRPVRPLVSWTLIAINVAVFILTQDELSPVPKLGNQIANEGVLLANAVTRQHQWWRLISYAFLHASLMHIFFNMYFLYSLGPVMEAMWGSARTLLLYFVAAITGGCVAVWVNRVGAQGHGVATVGASGALCGLLASLGVWVMLNREHLHPAVAASLSRNVLINLVFIGIVSFVVPNVSWEGHLGGAIGGALASFPLQWSRYGDTLLRRILGALGTLLVAAVFIVLVLSRSWGVQPPF